MTCPSCMAAQPDGLLCKPCCNRLVADLDAMPEWLAHLDDKLARQTQSGTGNGKSRSAEVPLPYDAHASKVGSYVRNQLQSWVHELDLGDTQGLADNPRAWCHWLVACLERIRMHPAVDELVGEIDYCTKLIRRAVDVPPSRVYLGPCQNVVDDSPCATQLYAYARHDTYTCPVCGDIVKVDERRDELLSLVEHQWATVATCARVLELFGIEVKAETIHNWARPVRGKLQQRGRDQAGNRLFRVGDVADLAREMRVRMSERHAG